MLKILRNRNWSVSLLFAGLVLSLLSCNREENDEMLPCKVISFSLLADKNPLSEDVVFEYNPESKTFVGSYLKWIDSDYPVSFIPSLNFEGESVYCGDIEIISGETRIQLTKDITLTVMNRSKKEEYHVSFICPQVNDELPVMRIHLNADTIKSKTEYLKTAVDVYTPGLEKIIWDSAIKDEVKIRGRGNSTWRLPKKPYRLKFPEKVDLFGIGHAEKNWVILAHDMDKSLIRNHLAFVISSQLFGNSDRFHDSKLFTPSSHFINVFFDDNYHGIYQFTDHIEKGKGRINVETLGIGQGEDLESITGGYMLESVYSFDETAGGFYTNTGIRMQIKYPDEDDYSPAQYQWIEDYVKEAESVLYSEIAFESHGGWRNYFDEKSLVDYIIVKELAGDMDGYISTRLYKKRGDSHFYFGPVWDLDKGWGNDIRIPFADYPPSTSLMMYSGFRMPGNTTYDWYMRLWDDAQLRKAVRDRWDSKKELLLNSVLDEIDSCEKRMRKSVTANYMVWPFDYQECQDASIPQKDYHSELERIRTLTVERATLLDILFN